MAETAARIVAAGYDAVADEYAALEDSSRPSRYGERVAVPEATFLVSDMLTVDLPSASFDAVVSIYAIDHVPRERHADVFRRIRSWLRPGGFAVVVTEDGDQPGVVGDRLRAPMFFSTIGREKRGGSSRRPGSKSSRPRSRSKSRRASRCRTSGSSHGVPARRLSISQSNGHKERREWC